MRGTTHTYIQALVYTHTYTHYREDDTRRLRLVRKRASAIGGLCARVLEAAGGGGEVYRADGRTVGRPFVCSDEAQLWERRGERERARARGE